MGGAKNCPETPRQKMIGMMYLVLTAMLALNVSADILNGFNKLRHSMESAIISTNARTEDVLRTFEAAYSKDEGTMKKYGDWWTIAQAVHKESDDFYNYLERFKLDIVNMVEGKEYTEMPSEIRNGSDTNKPHQYALNEYGESGKTHAAELNERMDAYREYMTTANSPCIQEKMKDEKYRHEWKLKEDMYKSLFSTDNVINDEGMTISWEQSIFDEMPAGAVFALLTKYQNDVRVAENDHLNFLFATAGSSDFVINSVEALVIPTNGEYIMQGQQYRARIVSAAVDTNQKPVFYIDGKEYTNGEYIVSASSVGPRTFNGYMLMPDDTTRYPFKGQYTVGAPSATISNTDLNIMYRGFKNKFSISVPGVGREKMKVSVSGGATCTQEGGMYVIVPGDGAKEVTVSVSAEVDGKTVSMGSQAYRVRALPKPGAFFKSGETEYAEGNIARSALLNTSATVIASYGPDGLLDLPYQILSFKLNINGVITECKGNKFGGAAMDKLGKLKKGNMVSITDVTAKGPDGKTVKLRGIPLTLN